MASSVKDKLQVKQLQKKRADREKAKSNAYLLKLSKDSSGSPLKLLLNEHQIKYAKDFLFIMAEHKFPGSEFIKLETKLSGKALNKHELSNDRHPDGNFVKSLFKWRQIWSGRGYPIGILTSKNSRSYKNVTDVYLCADSRLRCRRVSPVFDEGLSYASGFGVIPEKELTKYKFMIGRFSKGYPGHDESFQEYEFEALMFAVAENQLLY